MQKDILAQEWELRKLKKDQLQQLCIEYEVSPMGTKDDMIKRLLKTKKIFSSEIRNPFHKLNSDTQGEIMKRLTKKDLSSFLRASDKYMTKLSKGTYPYSIIENTKRISIIQKLLDSTNIYDEYKIDIINTLYYENIDGLNKNRFSSLHEFFDYISKDYNTCKIMYDLIKRRIENVNQLTKDIKDLPPRFIFMIRDIGRYGLQDISDREIKDILLARGMYEELTSNPQKNIEDIKLNSYFRYDDIYRDIRIFLQKYMDYLM